jgi:hypothetical protein
VRPPASPDLPAFEWDAPTTTTTTTTTATAESPRLPGTPQPEVLS